MVLQSNNDSMPSIKIIGAGSAGNHIAHACRLKGWDVTLTDTDSKALERTKTERYARRYGFWDENIRLVTRDQMSGESFDVVAIATPPASHLTLAIEELRAPNPCKIILIEKPLAPANDPHL